MTALFVVDKATNYSDYPVLLGNLRNYSGSLWLPNSSFPLVTKLQLGNQFIPQDGVKRHPEGTSSGLPFSGLLKKVILKSISAV